MIISKKTSITKEKTSSIDEQKNVIIMKKINFALINDLFHFIDDMNLRKRICILKIHEKNIFDFAHDENNH